MVDETHIFNRKAFNKAHNKLKSTSVCFLLSFYLCRVIDNPEVRATSKHNAGSQSLPQIVQHER
jgi:hypothetical protein